MRQSNARSSAGLLDRNLAANPELETDFVKDSPVDSVKSTPQTNWRIYIVAYNRLLRDTLGRLLSKRSELRVVGQSAATTDAVSELVSSSADILLLNSGGDINNDLFIA